MAFWGQHYILSGTLFNIVFYFNNDSCFMKICGVCNLADMYSMFLKMIVSAFHVSIGVAIFVQHCFFCILGCSLRC